MFINERALNYRKKTRNNLFYFTVTWLLIQIQFLLSSTTQTAFVLHGHIINKRRWLFSLLHPNMYQCY